MKSNLTTKEKRMIISTFEITYGHPARELAEMAPNIAEVFRKLGIDPEQTYESVPVL